MMKEVNEFIEFCIENDLVDENLLNTAFRRFFEKKQVKGITLNPFKFRDGVPVESMQFGPLPYDLMPQLKFKDWTLVQPTYSPGDKT